MRTSLAAVSIACLLALSCKPDHGDDDDGASDAGPHDAAADAPADAEPVERDAEVWPDAGIVEDEVIVWAHSSSTLYGFDPRQNTVTTVADFATSDGTPVEDMTDLAVDMDGRVLGCSYTALWEIDTESAEVTFVADLPLGADSRFFGLTFLPEGALDDAAETLVGATSTGEYFRIDAESGAAELIGQFSDGFVLSGDIVSVEGAGTYATVKRDDLASDALVELDPATGDVTRIGTEIGTVSLFGLGYWRSRLFGFSSLGELVEIDIERGTGSTVTAETGTDQFWGAGVTTIAPVGPF